MGIRGLSGEASAKDAFLDIPKSALHSFAEVS